MKDFKSILGIAVSLIICLFFSAFALWTTFVNVEFKLALEKPKTAVIENKQPISVSPSLSPSSITNLSKSSTSDMSSPILPILLVVFYFLPSIEAIIRKQHNGLAIFIMNFFLGWTVIGWLIALIWAYTKPTVAKI